MARVHSIGTFPTEMKDENVTFNDAEYYVARCIPIWITQYHHRTQADSGSVQTARVPGGDGR